MKKKIIFVLSTCLVVTLIALAILNVHENSQIKRDLISYYFEKDEGKIVESILNTDIRKIELDDYTVSLKESLCEKNTPFGYLLFEITKSDGKPNAVIDNEGYLKGFGPNNQYSFWSEATGYCNSKAEFSDNILYVYIDFSNVDFNSDESALENFLFVKDSSSMVDDDEYLLYPIELDINEYSKAYPIDDGTLFISPLGIKLEVSTEIDPLRITIEDKSGKILIDADSEKNMFDYHRERYNNELKAIYSRSSSDLLDISTIKNVILNDTTLEDPE